MNKLVINVDKVDECLRQLVADSGYPDGLKEVLEYSLFPGGKRLRPSLFLAWHELNAEADERAVMFASGIELFHTFSLVHDDMPCLDNDDYRRGKLSVHKKYGEAKALLAGDALLNLAYTAMLQSIGDCGAQAVLLVSKLFGGNGVISGQYDDVFHKCANADEVLDIYKRKTAALIYASCVAGCVFPSLVKSKDDKKLKELLCSNGVAMQCEPTAECDKNFAAAVRYGAAFGTAFQLYDDISECMDGEKPDSASVLDHMNIEEAKSKLRSLVQDATQSLAGLSGNASTLKELANKFLL